MSAVTLMRKALALGFPDFEDALQTACAIKVNADWIVTRNVRDFRNARISRAPAGAVLAAMRASVE